MLNKTSQTLVAAALTSCVALPALAANVLDENPRMAAYVSYSIGDKNPSWQDKLRYGFRMDHSIQSVLNAGIALPPIAEMDISSREVSAKINGVDLFQRKNYLLSQNEGDVAEAGSQFAGYTWLDWALIGVGVAAIGGGIYSLSNAKDDPAPQTTSTGGGGGLDLGGLTDLSPEQLQEILDSLGLGQIADPAAAAEAITNAIQTGGQQTQQTVCGIVPLPGCFTGALSGVSRRISPEYQAWLDGGTGHMGDLIPQH